jgi:hypothetical protein
MALGRPEAAERAAMIVMTRCANDGKFGTRVR